MLIYTTIALIAGYIADLIFGDPAWLYHPVQLIGKLIASLERALLKTPGKSNRSEFIRGMVLTIIVGLLCLIVPIAIIYICFMINTILAVVVMSIICYLMLAVRSLKTESMKVYDALDKGDIEDSRKAVSMIVGRDTESLDRNGVTRATVETIAEGFSDGVLAPMFYMAIGGPALMCLYKGINTMDSMIGYKNDKYMYFGRFAAKVDDVANFIPARLAGLMIVLSAPIAGLDFKNALKMFRRDRKKHASPNSAHTEAAMAGALDVQLAGNASYFGEIYEKPTIGDPVRDICADDIRLADKLMYTASILTVILFVVMMFLVLAFTFLG